jgi:hypothetical protein
MKSNTRSKNPMSKYTVHTCIKGVCINAEVDTFEEMRKVAESLIPLSDPEPEPEPVPFYLDATGKEFGLGSLLAFEATSGGFVLIYIRSMECNSKTNKWKIWVSRSTGTDDFHACEIEGEGGKPHPKLFKLEATLEEYMDATH